MDREPELTTLDQMLERIARAPWGNDRVSLDDVLNAVGRRSFGPVLLLAGLVTVAPVIGDIPGMPTLMSGLVLITAAQLLLRREHFWLPGWLLGRSIASAKLDKAVAWLRRPARWVDRWTQRRLTILTQGPGLYLIALSCIAIAAAMPPMEVVPFSANLAGAALIALGLALIAQDGVLAMLAIVLTGTGYALLAFYLF